jgi:hypothetical protein
MNEKKQALAVPSQTVNVNLPEIGSVGLPQDARIRAAEKALAKTGARALYERHMAMLMERDPHQWELIVASQERARLLRESIKSYTQGPAKAPTVEAA